MASEISSMAYRDKSQIIEDILDYLASEKGKAKRGYKIMYVAFLSWTQLKNYLGLLELNKFVEKVGTGYKITAKGEQWLAQYKKIPSIDYGEAI